MIGKERPKEALICKSFVVASRTLKFCTSGIACGKCEPSFILATVGRATHEKENEWFETQTRVGVLNAHHFHFGLYIGMQ